MYIYIYICIYILFIYLLYDAYHVYDILANYCFTLSSVEYCMTIVVRILFILSVDVISLIGRLKTTTSMCTKMTLRSDYA